MGKLYDILKKFAENPQENLDLLPELTQKVQEIEASEAALTENVAKLYESNLRLAKMVTVPSEPPKEEPKEPPVPSMQELAKAMLEEKGGN